MKLEDRLYSESEIRGKEMNKESERLYSKEEAQQISDFFTEFYDLNSENYSDVDEAYQEFIDAYTNIVSDNYAIMKDVNPNIIDIVPEDKAKITLNRKQTRAAGGALGAAVGTAAGAMLNTKDLKRKSSIEGRMGEGRASSADIKRLQEIKRRIKARKLGGAIIGGAAGYGGVVAAGKAANRQFSTEDLYSLKEKIKNRSLKGAATGAVAGGLIGGAIANSQILKADKKIDTYKYKIESLKKEIKNRKSEGKSTYGKELKLGKYESALREYKAVKNNPSSHKTKMRVLGAVGGGIIGA
jgi:hypothetical protein